LTRVETSEQIEDAEETFLVCVWTKVIANGEDGDDDEDDEQERVELRFLREKRRAKKEDEAEVQVATSLCGAA
jgi:hypothetical protein